MKFCKEKNKSKQRNMNRTSPVRETYMDRPLTSEEQKRLQAELSENGILLEGKVPSIVQEYVDQLAKGRTAMDVARAVKSRIDTIAGEKVSGTKGEETLMIIQKGMWEKQLMGFQKSLLSVVNK